MITLAAITSQIADALTEHARWNAAVKKLALSDLDIGAPMEIAATMGIPVLDHDKMPIPTRELRHMIVAKLDGCERELQALHKIHHNLISNGRAETPSDAPEPETAHMTVTPLPAAS